MTDASRKSGGALLVGRRRPELVATRVTRAEKAWIEALARAEGRTITELVYDLVVPEVRRRLSDSLIVL